MICKKSKIWCYTEHGVPLPSRGVALSHGPYLIPKPRAYVAHRLLLADCSEVQSRHPVLTPPRFQPPQSAPGSSFSRSLVICLPNTRRQYQCTAYSDGRTQNACADISRRLDHHIPLHIKIFCSAIFGFLGREEITILCLGQ